MTEVEPNDTAPNATAITLNDTASGTIGYTNDLDFFAIDLTAGTTVTLDVDAQALGSPLDPVVFLVDQDGVTGLAYNDDDDGLDSYLEYNITTSGRYFIAIIDYGYFCCGAGAGGPAYIYQIKTGALLPGPGDPTILYEATFGSPVGIAAGAAGEMYVADYGNQRLVRVAPGGGLGVTTVAQNLGYVFDVAVDASGDLLVTAEDTGGTFGSGVVWRVTPAGVRSVFAPARIPDGIAVAPNGDVWFADNYAGYLIRLDAGGVRKDSILIASAGGAADLAFSPNGVLHFSNGYDGVYMVSGGTWQQVISDPPYLEGLAFDQDGYLYVANGYLGRVVLYDPSYQVVHRPFARTHLGGPIQLAFGRNAQGGMTSRLLATNYGYLLAPPYAGGIVQMNPSGMRAPGWRAGAITLAEATDHLLTGAPLSITLQRYLDNQGNQNGRYDVGDLRAFLRTRGLLTAPPPPRAAP